MTELNRTDLTPSLKSDLATRSAGQQGAYGVVTRLAEEFGVSRPTVYSAGRTARAVVDEHFETASSGQNGPWVQVSEALAQRCVVALRVVGVNSIRAIEALLLVVLGLKWSYGKIQGVLAEAERRAAAFNASVDLGDVHAIAADEMFSQGDPVLAAIDLDSGYLVALEKRSSRAGEDWADVLGKAVAQGMTDVYTAVSDAAQGIKAGFRAALPEDTDIRDDCFHVLYKMGKVCRTLEQRAYGAIAAEDKASRALAQAKARGVADTGDLRRALSRARRKCHKAVDLYDAFHREMRTIHEALEFFDLEAGRVRTPESMQQQLRAAGERMAALGRTHEHKKVRKTATYVVNRIDGVTRYQRDVYEMLEQFAFEYGAQAVTTAALFHRLLEDIKRNRRPWDRHEDLAALTGAFTSLRSQLGSDRADALLDDVRWLLDHRHRASSAIEGFNAAMRPHLYVHKRTTQGFLELFRAYFNLRTRRWGRHKGTSPHELVTGKKVTDWLTMLGYPLPDAVH